MGKDLRKIALRQGQITLSGMLESVNNLHREAISDLKGSLLKFKAAGERLLEMKEQCKHGTFEALIESDACCFGLTAAKLYMKLAGGWDILMELLGPGNLYTLSLAAAVRKIPSQRREPKKESPPLPPIAASADRDTCFKGGKHVWEGDPELEGEYCAKCHERRPDVRDAADEGTEEHPGDPGGQGAEEEAAQGLAVGGLPDLRGRLKKALQDTTRLIDEYCQAAEDESLRKTMQDGLRTAWEAFQRAPP